MGCENIWNQVNGYYNNIPLTIRANISVVSEKNSIKIDDMYSDN